MTNHATRSAELLELAQKFGQELTRELEKVRPQAHTVNVLRDDVHTSLKLAEVHALLNIGHHLAAFAGAKREPLTGTQLNISGSTATNVGNRAGRGFDLTDPKTAARFGL